MTMLQKVTKTAGFRGDAVVGRENVMDGFYHLHSVILSLKTLTQYHKLTIISLPLWCTMSFLLANCRSIQGCRVGGLDRDLG